MRNHSTLGTIAVAVVAATFAPGLSAATASPGPGRPGTVQAVAAPALAGGLPGDAGRFATWTGYEVGTNPAAVAAADFNGDGGPDVAYAHHSFLQNTIAVQLNVGGGTLGNVTNYPAADETSRIAAADLNGDSHPDLVAISDGLSDTGNVIDVYMNKGNGTFAHSTVTGGNAPSALAIADFNGDSHPDLALANNSYNDQGTTVGVLFGTGTGTFGPETTYTVGQGVFGIAATDLDGDGHVDLAVGQATGAENAYHVFVLHNMGTGAFAVGADVSIPGITERWPIEPVVAAADVNGDGRVDLVAGAKLDDQIAVLVNQGHSAFTQSLLQASFGAVGLIAIDVDGDGHPDIVQAAPFGGTQSTGELSFLHGVGDGTFAPAVFINQGAQPNDVAAADFNGDGRLDLAVPNESSGTASIEPQLPSGRFAAAPVYQALAGLLPLDSASADFNGDGKIDMALGQIDISSTGHDRVALMQNLGDGRMRLTGSLPSGTDSNPKAVIAADLNGDGHPDLAWTPEEFTNDLYKVAVALNQGDGTFATPTVYTIQSCGTGHVSAIDVNSDGARDLVVANNRGGPSGLCDTVSRQLRILINNGDGTFQPDYPVELGSLNEMAVGADFNGDGITDLFVTDAISYLVLGTGGGQFGPPVSFSTRGTEVAVADFNADGRPDVATADGSFQTMSVMLNKGKGTFRTTNYPGEKIFGYLTGNAIAVGDLNGDGHLDIAVSDFQGQDVGVYYGLAKGAFRPQIRYGVQYDLSDVNLADYDGDGHPDIGGPAGKGGFPTFTSGVTTLINLTP